MFKIVSENDTFTAKELAGKAIIAPGREAYDWNYMSDEQKLKLIETATSLKKGQALVVDMGSDDDLYDHDISQDYKLRWNDIKGELR